MFVLPVVVLAKCSESDATDLPGLQISQAINDVQKQISKGPGVSKLMRSNGQSREKISPSGKKKVLGSAGKNRVDRVTLNQHFL